MSSNDIHDGTYPLTPEKIREYGKIQEERRKRFLSARGGYNIKPLKRTCGYRLNPSGEKPKSKPKSHYSWLSRLFFKPRLGGRRG